MVKRLQTSGKENFASTKANFFFLIEALILLLVLSLFSAPSSHATNPGSKCIKEGNAITKGGKKFTCVSVGGKLIWNSGYNPKEILIAGFPGISTCNKKNAGRIDSFKELRCVMVDNSFRFSEDGNGMTEGPFIYEFRAINEAPEDLCHPFPNSAWYNMYWYDGEWKCGKYYIEGEDGLIGFNWHRKSTVDSNLISKINVIQSVASLRSFSGEKTKPTTPKPSTSPVKSCETNPRQVKAYFGTAVLDGISWAAYVFENLSDCNLIISATIKVICISSSGLNSANSIFTTGQFGLSKREKFVVNNIRISRYFPQAAQQCYQLTGVAKNPTFNDFDSPPPSVVVLSAQR